MTNLKTESHPISAMNIFVLTVESEETAKKLTKETKNIIDDAVIPSAVTD